MRARQPNAWKVGPFSSSPPLPLPACKLGVKSPEAHRSSPVDSHVLVLASQHDVGSAHNACAQANLLPGVVEHQLRQAAASLSRCAGWIKAQRRGLALTAARPPALHICLDGGPRGSRKGDQAASKVMMHAHLPADAFSCNTGAL